MYPVRFPVVVAGTIQEATVTEDMSDIEHYRYRVHFTDGTEGIFTLLEGPELMILSDHPVYSSALADDLYELSKIDAHDNRFFFVFPTVLNNAPVNLWLMEEEPDPGESDCVMVSYYRLLQFQLYRSIGDPQWKVREITTPLPMAEKKIARELAQAMDVVQGVVSPPAP